MKADIQMTERNGAAGVSVRASNMEVGEELIDDD